MSSSRGPPYPPRGGRGFRGPSLYPPSSLRGGSSTSRGGRLPSAATGLVDRHSEDHQPNEGFARPRTSGAPVIGVAAEDSQRWIGRGRGASRGRLPSGGRSASGVDDRRWERGRDQDQVGRRAMARASLPSGSGVTSSMGGSSGLPSRPRTSDPGLPSKPRQELPPWPKSNTFYPSSSRAERPSRDSLDSRLECGGSYRPASSGWSRPASPQPVIRPDQTYPDHQPPANAAFFASAYASPAPPPSAPRPATSSAEAPVSLPARPPSPVGGSLSEPRLSSSSGRPPIGGREGPVAATSDRTTPARVPIDDTRSSPLPTVGVALSESQGSAPMDLESDEDDRPRSLAGRPPTLAQGSSHPVTSAAPAQMAVSSPGTFNGYDDIDMDTERSSRGSLSPISRALRGSRLQRESSPAGSNEPISSTAALPVPLQPEAEPIRAKPEPHSPNLQPTENMLVPGEEDVKPNIAHLPSPAPALPTPPAKRPTQGVASFPRSEVPASCYGPDKALARKAFQDEAIRRLQNECKIVSDFRWRDDGACTDWVVCLSDGTWNVWYPQGAVGTWGRKEKDAFKEAAKKDVGRTGWIVTKVRQFTDGRGIEVLWVRKQRERARDKDSPAVESAEIAMEGVISGLARPTTSGSGSDVVGEIVVAVDGLGLGSILPSARSTAPSDPVVAGPSHAAPLPRPAARVEVSTPVARSVDAVVASSISSREGGPSTLSDVARGKQPERVRNERSRSPPRSTPVTAASMSRRLDEVHALSSVASRPTPSIQRPAVSAGPVAPLPTAVPRGSDTALPAPTMATSRRPLSPPVSSRSIPNLADPTHPIPILAPNKTAPRQAPPEVIKRAPAPLPTPVTVSSRPSSSASASVPSKPSRPTGPGPTAAARRDAVSVRVAEGTSSAWAQARPSPKIASKKDTLVVNPASPAAAVVPPVAADAPAPRPSSASEPAASAERLREQQALQNEYDRLTREWEKERAARLAAEEETERLRVERMASQETPTDVLLTGYPADAKEMEIRTFISSTAIHNLGVTIHASHAVVTLRSAADAEETVRLLKDHDFRPGVRVTLLVTGVQRQQVNKPAGPNASSADPGRSSQLPTPPPNVAAERIEDDQIDSSSGEDVPIPSKPAARINHQIGVAGPGPSSLASAAIAPAVPREKKRKIIRHPTLSDSDDDVVTVVAHRASTAKRAKGIPDRVVPRPDAVETSRFRIKVAKVTKPLHVAGDKTRRFLVDDEFLIHASMRGRVNVWAKDTYDRPTRATQLNLPPGNAVEEASVAGDRLVLGLSRTKAEPETRQIGWVRLTDLDPMKAPEHGMFSQTPHSTVKTMSGVSTVLGLPTKVFSEDDVSVFASGGLDHTVRLWHVDEDGHASSEELHSVSKSRVESLLYCTKDNILFSAGGAKTVAFDMASYKISDEISVPNAEGLQINYVHFGATSKTLILETRRVTNQFKLFDLRRSRTQLLDFGTQPSAANSSGTSTTKYKKGSYRDGYFACGEDGIVKIWDMRKLPAPCQEIRLYIPGTDMRQVTFFSGTSSSSRLLADLTKETLSIREYTRT